MSDDDFDLVRGSGNVFRDLNQPNADLEQLRALLAAQVLAVEPTGPETHVHVQVGKQMLVCAFRDHEPIQPGTVISILPDASRVHVFAADGTRVG